MCKKAYIMPQGPICHEPVVHHALCVTIPIWHKVRYGTRPLCTMTFVSQFRYVTGSDMSQARLAPCPLCHNSDMAQSPICQSPLCTTSFLSQFRYGAGSDMSKPVVHHVLRVTMPIYHSRELFMRRVVYVAVTLCLSDMSQGPICHNCG